MSFTEETAPENWLNFGTGLAQDFSGALDIDIRRIMIHEVIPNNEYPNTHQIRFGIRVEEVTTRRRLRSLRRRRRRRRRRLADDAEAGEGGKDADEAAKTGFEAVLAEIRGVFFAMQNLFELQSPLLVDTDFGQFIKFEWTEEEKTAFPDVDYERLRCECNAVLECDDGCGQLVPAGFLKPETLDGYEQPVCIIDGCLVDSRTQNLFAQSLKDNPSKLIITNCKAVFNPDMAPSLRTDILDKRSQAKTESLEFETDPSFIYGVDKELWHSMVTGILDFSHYLWEVEVWVTEPPNAQVLIFSVEDEGTQKYEYSPKEKRTDQEIRVRRDDEHYEPWKLTLEPGDEGTEKLQHKFISMGAPASVVDSVVDGATLKIDIEGNKEGVSPCDVFQKLPVGFDNEPVFCVE